MSPDCTTLSIPDTTRPSGSDLVTSSAQESTEETMLLQPQLCGHNGRKMSAPQPSAICSGIGGSTGLKMGHSQPTSTVCQDCAQLEAQSFISTASSQGQPCSCEAG